MQTDALLWILLPVFIAAGSALLSFYVMQARVEVAVSKERETLAEARAEIRLQKSTMEERVKASEQEARRKALDEFMQDFRIEERHYFRENKSAELRQKSMVLQERLFFRNIPLSNWVEHEMLVEEEGMDVKPLARARSVFRTKVLSNDNTALSHLLQQANASTNGVEFAQTLNGVETEL